MRCPTEERVGPPCAPPGLDVARTSARTPRCSRSACSAELQGRYLNEHLKAILPQFSFKH